MIFGWDGASYQGRPDVALLKQEGHDFVIEKVTGEGNYVNPYWTLVRQDARAAGVVFGGYDWIEPQMAASWPADVRPGVAAARDFLGVLGPRAVGELLCVDFETPDWFTGPLGRDIEGFMQDYLYTLRNEGNCPVIVYTAQYFLEETGADNWAWLGADFILWQSAPGPLAMLPDDYPWPVTPVPFPTTAIHQHQWHATSPAIAGEFDRDRFQGTIEDLRALGLPGAPPPPVVTPPKEGEVIEPAEGKYTAYINEQGQTIFVANMGGVAKRIDGIAAVDLGVSVVGTDDALYDRSIQGNAVQVWHKRPAPDATATEHPVGQPGAVQ